MGACVGRLPDGDPQPAAMSDPYASSRPPFPTVGTYQGVYTLPETQQTCNATAVLDFSKGGELSGTGSDDIFASEASLLTQTLLKGAWDSNGTFSLERQAKAGSEPLLRSNGFWGWEKLSGTFSFEIGPTIKKGTFEFKLVPTVIAAAP